MSDYKNIDKIKPETLLNLFTEVMYESSDFKFISGTQPFLMSFKNEEFHIYIKNVSSAYFSDRDKTTRAQLPMRPEFDRIRQSSNPFVFLGYDGLNDVYVCWNFHIAKERLNIGKSVSFYSRSFFQSEVKEGEFCRRPLKNGDMPVFFKRRSLIEFFERIHTFFRGHHGDHGLIELRHESLEEDFVNYLTFEKNLSKKSISNYVTALKGRITTGLQRYFSADISSVFFIDDTAILFNLNHNLFKTAEYQELNQIGKSMYSCAFDNYIEFVSDFQKPHYSQHDSSIVNFVKESTSNAKLLNITDEVLLQKIDPYIKSNRILTAAQVIGEYYDGKYPSMGLKDWIELARKCSTL